jgi:hypothetical protein
MQQLWIRFCGTRFGRGVLLAMTAYCLTGALDVCRAQEPGLTILQQLREKKVEQALQTLGPVSANAELWAADDTQGLVAAGGGLSRALAQLDEDEQYTLLYAWSMPAEERKNARIFTTFVPRAAPPELFARLLRERPRETSFAVSSIGGVPGLFSTGWSLVKVADELGRLNRLTTELEELAGQDVPNADVLLMLARLADSRIDEDEAKSQLEALSNRLGQAALLRVPDRLAIHSSQVALAAAALNHEALQPSSVSILEELVGQAKSLGAPRRIAFLRLAHAVAVQTHIGKSGPEFLMRNRLKYWVPVSNMTAATSAQGAVPAMWLTHEEHILHLTGSQNDVLFFRYPLTGEFDFTCETQVGGPEGTDGGLVYGGLQFQSVDRSDRLNVWDADLEHVTLKPCPFVRQEANRAIFNRASIRSKADQIHFAANLHPMWFDRPAASQSPWLGLRSRGEHRPMFRNFKLTGQPVIPKEVSLSVGDELRGWQSHFFGETQPRFTAGTVPVNVVQEADAAVAQAASDWSMTRGVIEAAKQEVAEGGSRQSLLRYQRPLLEGETISYEFLHQADESEVHPAIGRLAFLLEPGGIRIHWITDGALEWTGLPEDNATLEPLNRRGPRPFPLKNNDWNTVSVSLNEGKINISLNDSLVYTREMEKGPNSVGKFGLYRDRGRGVQVRNVVITGDWPQEVPQEFQQNPTTLVDEEGTGETDQSF